MKDKDSKKWTLQVFRDTARHRIREAQVLLEHPKKQKRRDGAVTYGLLAVECALKSLILFSYPANSVGDLPEQMKGEYFSGISGHKLQALYGGVASWVCSQIEAAELEAIRQLNGRQRYDYRYGVKRTEGKAASVAVKEASLVIDWMERVTS